MVFDHGVDCICAGVAPLIFARVAQIGDNFIAKFFFMSIYQTFYLMTLEHYYKGILTMPMINGVSDGAIWICCACMYSAYKGNNFWTQPVYDAQWMGLDGVEWITLGQALILATSFGTHLIGLNTIYGLYKSRNTPTPTQNFPIEFWTLMKDWSVYYVWTAVWLVFAYQGNDPIVIKNPPVVNPENAAFYRDQLDYGQAYHTIHYLLYMFVIVYQCHNIMGNQICKQRYQPYGNLMKSVLFTMCTIMVIGYFRDGDVNFKMCVTLICGVVAVFLGQFIVSVIGEITTILGIEVFVTKQEQEARRQRLQLKQQAAALKQKKGPSSIYSASTNGTKVTSFSEET